MDGFKLVQTPSMILMLYVDLTYRQVFLDGRALENDPNPAWMGYSVGHWDGDTLVVKSNGYNERTWLDLEGSPHSGRLRVTERFHRKDFGQMDLNVTIEDPGAYSRPIRYDTVLQAVVDTEMMEYVCAASRGSGRLAGTSRVFQSPGRLAKGIRIGSCGFPIRGVCSECDRHGDRRRTLRFHLFVSRHARRRARRRRRSFCVAESLGIAGVHFMAVRIVVFFIPTCARRMVCRSDTPLTGNTDSASGLGPAPHRDGTALDHDGLTFRIS